MKLLEHKRARTVAALAAELSLPQFSDLLARFLFSQLHPDNAHNPSEVPLTLCPKFDGRIHIFNSASSQFYAPSDLSGIGGMRREYIRAAPMCRWGHPHYDCIFVNTDANLEGLRGMNVARVLTFFSFKCRGVSYPCAVVRWFDTVGDSPDEDTGMWVVRPAYCANNSPNISVIHIDTIYRAAHLIPVYGTRFVPPDLKHYQTYDFFRKFYVNKYADHHAFEIAS